MNRPTSFTTPIFSLALVSLVWLSSLAPALAATVTDTFQLKATGTERCRDDSKFVETVKWKILDGKTLTVTRDVLGTGDLTDIQATINNSGNATIDAITLNGRALPANKAGSTAQLVLSGRDSGNPDRFLTLRGKATFDKAGKLTNVTGTYVYQVLPGLGGASGIDCFGSGTFVTIKATFGGGGISDSVRYHFFYSSGGPLMAVDPAAPAAPPVTVAPVVSKAISVYSSTWNAPTTSFVTPSNPVFEVYASAGKLWRVKVAKSSGVPGGASNLPVQISSESAATQLCTFSEVFDASNPNTRRLFYELPGADGQCGLFFGSGGTNADNITKSVLISDGDAVTPTVLPTGLSRPTSIVYNLSTGIATHMFLIDAANSDTLKIINLSTLSTQTITPTQTNISSIFSVVQDTSNRVFLSSSSFDPNTFTFTNTLYVYTVSSNTVVPLVTGVPFASGENSDGTNLFVANTTDGILYRVPLTATVAGDVPPPILNIGGQINSYGVTTNRVFVVVPVSTTETKIISVPKSGGVAPREDVPAAAGTILSQAAGNRFYYTRSVLSSTPPVTVVSSTTVALKEDGTPLKLFADAGLAGIRFSLPFNVRGPIGVVTEVLVSTYVAGVLNGGTMTAVDAPTAVATTIVGTIPSTVPSLVQLFFSWSSVDHAALGLGFLSESINWGVFFMDSATPNSLVQVPVALGSWQVVP